MYSQRATPAPVLALKLFFALGWSERLALLKGWNYRFDVYGCLHLLDDPAWLALMFC